jgi:hypothetical protein
LWVVGRAGTVTVLFTDVVGSTELIAALGEDAWHALLQEHLGGVAGDRGAPFRRGHQDPGRRMMARSEWSTRRSVGR